MDCVVCLFSVMFSDVGGGVPMLHLYGEAGGRALVPALLEVVLLCVRAAVADGAAVAMPPLPRVSPPARARQLPLGGGGDAADRDHAADQLHHSPRKLPGQVVD